MKKLSFNSYFLLILLLPFGLLGSCRFRSSDSVPGKLVTQTRNVRNFNGIKASAGVQVYLTQGDHESVEVSAGENIISKVKTEVEGGILHIYFQDNNGSIFSWNNGRRTIKVSVSAKTMESIEASSGSSVEVTQNIISAEHLKLASNSGASLKLGISTQDLEIESSSGSSADITGKASHVTGSASSGSSIKAEDLHSETSKLEASSGGNISMGVSKSLDGHASSGGSIKYKGNPSSVSKDKSSGGSIESI